MPRCKKTRCCRILQNEIIFKPTGIPLADLEIVEIEVDELEAVRLCDYENKSQIEAGEIMEISRGTIQRLLNEGRRKILDALLHKKAIKLKNDYSDEIKTIGDDDMNKNLRVGFGTNDGVNVGDHFGHCANFVIFTIEDGNIVNKEMLAAPEHAPGVFPRFIAENKVDVVIIGTMGSRAFDMIKANGGEVILGINGKISTVLETYLAGNLKSQGTACQHHHHHEGEDHHCKH